MTNPKKREKQRSRFDEGLKRKIAKEYLSGKASYAILAQDHGLANKSVVKEFVKWYKRQLEQESLNTQNVKKSGENQVNQPLKSGVLKEQDELKILREQLALSELKCEMLETMIQEAEKALCISIKKKYGTNQ
jgi:transposase-like protein